MMTKARGPLWHQPQKPQGVLPDGVTGLAQDATWRDAHAAGWVSGHGAFGLVSHQTPVLGRFQGMPNGAPEAKRLPAEIVQFPGVVKTVCLDRQADEHTLYALLKRQHRLPRLPTPRRGLEHPPRARRCAGRGGLHPSGTRTSGAPRLGSRGRDWSKTCSRETRAGCVATETRAGSLRPWGLPYRWLNVGRIGVVHPRGTSQRRASGDEDLRAPSNN